MIDHAIASADLWDLLMDTRMWHEAELCIDRHRVVSKLRIRENLRTRQRTARVERRVKLEAFRDKEEVTCAGFARVMAECTCNYFLIYQMWSPNGL